MNTTRTSVRASALTIALTALLIGAPAVAFADPSMPNPLPGNAAHPQTCQWCPKAPAPILLGSNSGYGVHPEPLRVGGEHFTDGGMIHFDVFVAAAPGAAVWTGTETADSGGVVDGAVANGVNTADPGHAVNGYVVATDLATGQQSNRLPVLVVAF
jgi:hypothetical protein